MFFNDYSQRKVFKATPDGTVTEHVDHSAIGYFAKMDIDSQNNIYIAGLYHRRVYKIAGNTTSGVGTSYSAFGPLYPEDLIGVGVNSNDEIFVYSGGSIFRVINNYSGYFETYATQSIDVALTFNQNDEIIFNHNNTIKKMDANKTVTTIAGSSSTGLVDENGTSARFGTQPSGLVVDQNNNIIVADTSNNVIRKIDTNNDVTTFALDGTENFSDNIDKLAAQMDSPYELAIGPYGNIYVCGRTVAGFGIRAIGQPSIPVPVLHTNYDVLPSVNIRNTSNDSVGAVMKLSNARGNNAGVNNDTAGELRFLANDDANNLQSFGKIKVTATDVTNESETGKMTLGVSSSDTGGIDDIIQIQGGASAVTSQTDIAGVATVGSTLTVDGATAIKSTLSVTGATNITSTLDVTGQIKSGRFGANSSITEPGVILNMAGGSDICNIIR